MENLKQLRRAKNYTQLQLSSFLHISPSTVAMWEKGSKSPTLGQVLKLCSLLDCLPRDFYRLCSENQNCLPVFTLHRSNSLFFEDICLCGEMGCCDFGLVMPFDLNRIACGDVCFFKLTGEISRETDIVIALGNDAEVFICPAAEMPPHSQPVAVSIYMLGEL